MYKSFLKLRIIQICLIVSCIYALIPLSGFPNPPANSPQSQEPGDLLDPQHRKAYFTNLSRQEILDHYRKQFKPAFAPFLPQLNLNYPPEESKVYVYDPLLSSYLEELVFPLRESLYINGYEPKDDQDKIAYQGIPYKTKITVRYYPSSVFARIVISWTGIIILYIAYLLGKTTLKPFITLFKKT